MLSGIIDIDRGCNVGLAEQIYRQIRLAVRDRRISSGQKLPSSRGLAKTLGVSRNTVIEAYKRLEAEQIVSVRPGAAPVVEFGLTLETAGGRAAQNGQGMRQISKRGHMLCQNPRAGIRFFKGGILQSGVPALDVFPEAEWARAVRRAARTHRTEEVFYDHIAGLPRLRTEIADLLADTRGVVAAPEQILICSSTQASLSILANCLADVGDHALIEEPGYLGARGAFKSHGLKLAPLAVDENGAMPPDGSMKIRPKLIYLTPSHQYPLGYSMALSRRLAFIDYARTAGALILEDDYDSEFLFSKRPVASMQGLAAGSEVVYLGTFAKTMLPGIRVAYLVAPQALVEPLAQAIHNTGAMANVHAQAALADFIASGHYRAHLKKIRAIYQERGEALVSALTKALGDRVEILMPTGGVQLVMKFTTKCDDIALSKHLQAQGIAVAPLSSTYMSNGVSGLTIGFSTADPKAVQKGVKAIAQAVGLFSP